MSPEAKAKAATRAQSEPAVDDGLPGSQLNASFFTEYQAIYDKVMEHPIFKDLPTAQTLGYDGRDGTGVQAPFDLENYRASMRSHGLYRCAMNELFLGKWFTVLPGIPDNRNAIFSLARQSFSNPGEWHGTNVVYVPDKTKYSPMHHQGSLQRLSPEEPNFARIIGIGMAIDSGADDTVLRTVRRDILCSPFMFEFFDGGLEDPTQGAVPRAINLRETSIAEASAVGRDTLQRIFEVIKTRKIMRRARAWAK